MVVTPILPWIRLDSLRRSVLDLLPDPEILSVSDPEFTVLLAISFVPETLSVSDPELTVLPITLFVPETLSV